MKLVTKEQFRQEWNDYDGECHVPYMYPPVLEDSVTKQIICVVYEENSKRINDGTSGERERSTEG